MNPIDPSRPVRPAVNDDSAEEFFRMDSGRVMGRILQAGGVLVAAIGVSMTRNDIGGLMMTLAIAAALLVAGTIMRSRAEARARFHAHLKHSGMRQSASVTAITKALVQFGGRSTSDAQLDYIIRYDYAGPNGEPLDGRSAALARVHFPDLQVGDTMDIMVDPDRPEVSAPLFWIAPEDPTAERLRP